MAESQCKPHGKPHASHWAQRLVDAEGTRTRAPCVNGVSGNNGEHFAVLALKPQQHPADERRTLVSKPPASTVPSKGSAQKKLRQPLTTALLQESFSRCVWVGLLGKHRRQLRLPKSDLPDNLLSLNSTRPATAAGKLSRRHSADCPHNCCCMSPVSCMPCPIHMRRRRHIFV